MNIVEVRNVKIGDGIPKICVPIVGVTKEDILEETFSLKNCTVDIVEWRADWFDDVFAFDKVEEVLRELRKILDEIPLLVTFRTAREGGEKEIHLQTYVELIKKIVKTGYVDLVDVELFTGDDMVKEVVEASHEAGVMVIVSNHDFNKTPSEDDIIFRLRKMQDLGADIPKIAVMPKNKLDVLTLLLATQKMHTYYAKNPIITMSMGGEGVITRVCGEVFGSALTFGAVKKASAPGQMKVEDLNQVLQILHKSLGK